MVLFFRLKTLNSDEPKNNIGLRESRLPILRDVRRIYERLDARIAAELKPACRICGVCCDFDGYGHRLYVSTPELLYFLSHLDKELRFMTDGVCPYLEEGRCGAYRFRFAACRIFCCTTESRKQHELSEEVVGQFRRICEKYNLPYRYLDLQYALSRPELWIG